MVITPTIINELDIADLNAVDNYISPYFILNKLCTEKVIRVSHQLEYYKSENVSLSDIAWQALWVFLILMMSRNYFKPKEI